MTVKYSLASTRSMMRRVTASFDGSSTATRTFLTSGGDGKTEKDYLHDGHAQQNQHRAPVAEDVEELFSDERYELFHGLYLYLGSVM